MAVLAMRIRQVRPEFFTDATMASLSPTVRLTYIGLWCVADDAGWFRWDVAGIGALLFPFETAKRRERELEVSGAALVAVQRIVRYPCGCAHIPHLVDHQKIGGNKSLTAMTAHRVHTNMDESARNVKVGNVKVGNGSAGATELSEFRARVARPVVVA